MKKMTMLVICGFTILNLVADDTRQPYVIHRKAEMVTVGDRQPYMRKEEIIIVSNMPTFTVSEPITNSFVFNNGEYIPPPYVVLVSNLTVFLNEIVVGDYERRIHNREWYREYHTGTTPETVGKLADSSAEGWADSLRFGTVFHLMDGQTQRSRAMRDGDGGTLALVELARKAMQGDEQAKQELIKEMMLEYPISQSKVRTDWIERLANNTNLEVRATRLLDAKRDRERQEQELDRQRQERREQLKRQREQQNP